MHLITIDSKNTQFVLEDRLNGEQKRFDGTVSGALAMLKTIVDLDLQHVMNSSDLNHPDEFPKFEKHAIDVAAGYIDGAIKDGIIKIQAHS